MEHHRVENHQELFAAFDCPVIYATEIIGRRKCLKRRERYKRPCSLTCMYIRKCTTTQHCFLTMKCPHSTDFCIVPLHCALHRVSRSTLFRPVSVTDRENRRAPLSSPSPLTFPFFPSFSLFPANAAAIRIPLARPRQPENNRPTYLSDISTVVRCETEKDGRLSELSVGLGRASPFNHVFCFTLR